MIEAGLTAEVAHEVAAADTARALGSGDVEVLGTPVVVACCEGAAVRAVEPHLEAGQTSVGVHIAMEHLAPTLPGRRIVAWARLEEVNGRNLRFSIEASDGAGLVARGSHVRVLVERDRFLETASARG